MYKHKYGILGDYSGGGKGSRLKSNVAKLLHKVAGRAMINWVSAAAEAAGASAQICVAAADGGSSQLPSNVKTKFKTRQRGKCHQVLPSQLSSYQETSCIILCRHASFKLTLHHLRE